MVQINSRGQALMSEFMIYFLIVLMMLGMLFVSANAKIRTLCLEKADYKKQLAVYYASEALVTTTGAPDDWRPGNVVTLGLAQYDKNQNTVMHHQLDEGKIGRLRNMDITEVSRALRLDDYSISLSIKSSKMPQLKIGPDLVGITIKRVALCGGVECVIEITAQ